MQRIIGALASSPWSFTCSTVCTHLQIKTDIKGRSPGEEIFPSVNENWNSHPRSVPSLKSYEQNAGSVTLRLRYCSIQIEDKTPITNQQRFENVKCSLTEAVFCSHLPHGVRVDQVIIGNSTQFMLVVTQVVFAAATKTDNC